MWEIVKGSLCYYGTKILNNAVSVSNCQRSENGAFLTVSTDVKAAETVYSLGYTQKLSRFTACYRNCPFFMSAQSGVEISAVPKETMCLLMLNSDGNYVLMLPIFDDCSRGALQGSENGLELIGVTGSAKQTVSSGELIYITYGKDPYDMMNKAAVDIKKKLKSFKLREEKIIPEFMGQVGWCTYNAFYFDVNSEKILEGLKTFKDNGFIPGFVLLDDGWLTTTSGGEIGSRVMTEFNADSEKFKGGLLSLTNIIKENYGIEDFMVWHASMGYWAGSLVGEYGEEKDVYFSYPSRFAADADSINRRFAHHPIKPDKVEEFFNEFHSYLASQGVKGVKIDVQYLFEGLCDYAGGRKRSMDIYRQALENSVLKNFDNNCLNCMSCSNDMLYRMENTNVLRSGSDYVPMEEPSLGFIASNALNTYWIYPIAFADWDMFWSNYKDGFIEAVARVCSGSPIYVSDKVGNHDYELLKALSVDGGKALRPLEPGRPTIDCLMYNAVNDRQILKVFNRNYCTYIIGVMNLVSAILTTKISPLDIYGLPKGEYIVKGFKDKKIRKLSSDDSFYVNYTEKNADLYTFSPLVNGAAVLGLEGKINGSAAVKEFNFSQGVMTLITDAGGKLRIYSEARPQKISVNNTEKDFEYEENIIYINI